ncbi:DUF2029 domain-containing protein [Candidatus Woesearchaeota archaeon]|nr:DUF2029 domain-containing protein [Candidatus Woesearchaeota archaeon]
MKIKKKDILKYLIITVIFSVSFCFIVKYLGIKKIIPWNIGYSDLGPWSNKAFEKGFPYADKFVEYPVIIGITMHLASRLGGNFYLYFHYIIFLACAIISTIYLYKLSEIMGTNKKYLFIFWALAPSLLWFSFYNWDIIAVMFSILAVYYYKERKDILAAIFLSLGFSTKMYPVLFLFPVLLHRRFKDWIRIGMAFLGTFLAVNAYFMINNFTMWYGIYGFHSQRMPNPDSIWWIIMQFIPSLNVETVNTLTLIIFASGYLIVNFKFRKKGFIFASFMSVFLFLLVNKVFSPQYLLWLLPFFALFGLNMIAFYLMEFLNLAVLFSTLIHIFSFQEFTTALVYSSVFVVLRHIVLAYAFVKKIIPARGAS